MQLTDQEQQHSQRARAFIEQQLANGAMSFANYMQHALYAPEWGYYTCGKSKFGAQGDFITAPEISPLFSQCLASYCQPIAGDILEFGAGSGIMAAEILRHLQQQQALPEHYYILEPSPALQALQRETLNNNCPQCLDRVTWLSQLPKAFNGVILANEVIDAMPVELFRWQDGQYQQGIVTPDWQLAYRPVRDPRLAAHLAKLPSENFANGYCSEVNLHINPWIASLADCLQQGAVVLIDYGYPRREYYLPQREQGTLLCYFHHQTHAEPLWGVGVQDITAHVDFTDVAEAALAYGLDIEGFTTQANFLLHAGLLQRYQQQLEQNPQQAIALNQQIKQLTQPQEMGEAVKVMVLSKAFDGDALAFERDDQCHRL